MKQLEVQIMGQSYLLGCPEGGDSQLLDAVEKVDSAMCKIRDAGKVKARDRIAVLAALNLAFELSDRDAALLRMSTEMAARDAEPKALAGTVPPRDGAVNDPRLASLLERLDGALADDGRLI